MSVKNKNSTLRVILSSLVVLWGAVFAAPSVLPYYPSVQVGWADAGYTDSDKLALQVQDILLEAGIEVLGTGEENGRLTYRFIDVETQVQAQIAIENALGALVIASLNLTHALPSWMIAVGAKAINLGLDLRGGVYFLFEIDSQAIVQERLLSYQSELVKKLREERIRFDRRKIQLAQNSIQIPFDTPSQKKKALELIEELGWQLESNADEVGVMLRLTLPQDEINLMVTAAREKNIVALRKRVDELGVSEPQIQGVGEQRIAVQIPGVRESNSASRILDKASTLEFRLEADSTARFSEKSIVEFKDIERESSAELLITPVVKGENVIDASVGYDENGQAVVSIVLDDVGGSDMFEATRSNIGRRMGVVLVETRLQENEKTGEVQSVQEKRILTLPAIRGNFGARFQIEGSMTATEASDLALILRAGALAAPMKRLEERTVGPSLGEANIKAGMFSAIGGFILVLLFMMFYYRLWGVIASFSLVMNLALILAMMSQINAALSLPGIAGLVLTVGMAVDANVLIFSRIKEELASGASLSEAVSQGYDRAFVSIFDANITTLMAAVTLYLIGTGPVQGFAITLSFGILTSLFSAILLSRILVNYSIKYVDSHPNLGIGWSNK